MADKPETPSYADGGLCVFGTNEEEVLECQTGGGKLFDPERDVLRFFPQLLRGVVVALATDAYPRLKIDRAADPSTGIGTAVALKGLFEEFVKAAHAGGTSGEPLPDYDTTISGWSESTSPEARDRIIHVIGRLVLQYYLECVRKYRRHGISMPESETEIARALKSLGYIVDDAPSTDSPVSTE
jgi:hypothetical protein